VLSKKLAFERGIIHSDFNESNILVEGSSPDDIRFTGLLDFGDTHYSFRIADVANAIVYLYLWACQNIQEMNQEVYTQIASDFLKGYRSHRDVIPDFDFQHLGLFMKARLVCSLVYGLRTVRINIRKRSGDKADMGSTEYVLKTQEGGWATLQELDGIDLKSAFQSH